MNAIMVVLAAIEIISPSKNETVQLIPDGQSAVITNETLSAREDVLASRRNECESNATNSCWRVSQPVVFRWRMTDGERGPWEIMLATNPELTGARQFLFTTAGAVSSIVGKRSSDEQFCVLPYANFEIGTRYYWRVSGNLVCGKLGHGRNCGCADKKPIVSSEIGSFTTEDLAPRWIKIEGRVGNFRDLGGRIGLGGKRIRQGLIYRSEGLNDNSVDGISVGKNRLTVNDLQYLKKTLGIRTDLDLRCRGEVAGLNGVSPLGEDVRYVNNSSSGYDGLFTPYGKRIMAANFLEFVDRRNYPILFHCIAGADRTGSLAYVLNGVLGVRRQELETDWESTFYPRIPNLGKDGKPVWNSELHFNRGFEQYGDKDTPWSDRIVLYLKDCGITDEEIEAFRSIMIETVDR